MDDLNYSKIVFFATDDSIVPILVFNAVVSLIILLLFSAYTRCIDYQRKRLKRLSDRRNLLSSENSTDTESDDNGSKEGKKHLDSNSRIVTILNL